MKATVPLATAVCCCVLVAGAVAEPVTVVRRNGPNDNRINVAILGDGYTSEEVTKYSTDVELLLADLFGESPFSEYESYFNVRRIDVVSNESGADHPADGVFRDTALGASYCGAEVGGRLICVDYAAIRGVLERSVTGNLRDIVMVLVNDDEYGGAGGVYAVTSTNEHSSEIMMHELGHSFGLLADEYSTSASFIGCNNSIEPPEVNVTRESMRDSIKWSHWIEPDTEIPAMPPRRGVVSAYEGAKYCHSGLYRPTYDSKMRSLNRPFEQVNTEQLIRRIYNWVSPIDWVEPAVDELTSDRCEFLDFFVQTPGEADGLPGTLETTWRIDGEVVGGGDSLTLVSCALPAGWHRVEAEVRDTTPAVRRDPDSALVERYRWNVLAPESEILSGR